MNRPIKLFSRSMAVLELALFLMAATVFAQGVTTRVIPSTRDVQTAAHANESLQMALEKLSASAGVSPNGDARVGPDDLLNIAIFEAPEMNSTVRVSAAGNISLPLLGVIHAAGLTPSELESLLQSQLRRTYMKDPHVSVFLQELQSHPVSVVGAVKMPGVFQIRGSKTLIEVLSLAQGLADDAGDTVFIMHGPAYSEASKSISQVPTPATTAPSAPVRAIPEFNSSSPFLVQEVSGAVEEINLKNLLESSDPSLNVLIRPGDIVKVTRAGIVYVVGEVNKPGGFVLQNNESISVLQALALAQGTTHTSAISQARIIRTDPATGRRSEIPMNLGKVFSGKKPDALLQPKDIVFVPNSAAKSVFYRSSEAALQTAAGVAIYKW